MIVGQHVQTGGEKSRLILRLGRARQRYYVDGTRDSGHTSKVFDEGGLHA